MSARSHRLWALQQIPIHVSICAEEGCNKELHKKAIELSKNKNASLADYEDAGLECDLLVGGRLRVCLATQINLRNEKAMALAFATLLEPKEHREFLSKVV